MKVSLVIPAYNEQDNLVPLLDTLLPFIKKQKGSWELVLVDDHSTDATARIADGYAKKNQNLKVIHRRSGNRGMGATLIEGTKKASGDIIIWSMADLSDEPATYPKMVAQISKGCDVVFGSRYIKGGSRGDLSVFKALFSNSYSTVARLVFGLPVHDITNAFRAFRREVFDDATPCSADFAISPEFAIKAHLRGYRLCEVPTTYKNRVAGKTSFRMLSMGLRYGFLFRYLLTYPRK